MPKQTSIAKNTPIPMATSSFNIRPDFDDEFRELALGGGVSVAVKSISVDDAINPNTE